MSLLCSGIIQQPNSLFFGELTEESDSQYLSTSQTEIQSECTEKERSNEENSAHSEEQPQRKQQHIRVNAKLIVGENVSQDDEEQGLGLDFKISPFFCFIDDRFSKINLLSENKQ